MCEPGSKHLEIAVVRKGVDGVDTLDEKIVDEVIKKIEDEKAAAEEAKKRRAQAAEEAARAAQG